MTTTYRRIDVVIQTLLAEDDSAGHDQLARELTEVLDYQHEHDLEDHDFTAVQHLDVHHLFPEGRMADPIVMLLQPVR